MELLQSCCPLCGGSKKVFQVSAFLAALGQCNGNGRRATKPEPAFFINDCSVCAGNGWVQPAVFEAAKHDADSWRHLGVRAY